MANFRDAYQTGVNRPICQCRRRASTNLSSISRPPGHSASRCRRRGSPAPMKIE